MAAAALIATAVLSGISAMAEASAASSQADAEKSAAEYNAATARDQAANAARAASANEDAKRRESAMRLGSQRAALTESGVDITSGTGADLMAQSTLNTEMDALNIRYQGKLQAKGYNDQAALDDMAASAAGKRKSSAWVTGGLKAGGSVLSGVGIYGYLSSSSKPDLAKVPKNLRW